MHDKQSIFIFQIHDHDKPLTPQELKILLDLTQNGNNLTFAIMLLATSTKVKKKLDSNEYLVYFDSPVPLPLIFTNLVSVISNKDDTHKYKQLNSDNYYHLVGIPRIKSITIAEARYLIDLLNKIPALLNPTNTTCKGRKNLSNRE